MATKNVYEVPSDKDQDNINAQSGNPAFEHFDDPIGVVNTQQPRARVSVPQTQDKPADVPMSRQPKSWWPVMTVILFSLVALGLVILGVHVYLQLERLVSYSHFVLLKCRIIITF